MQADRELFRDASHWAQARSLNLIGIADARTFDRCQPAGRRARDLSSDCGTILLLGSGGRANWEFLRGRLGDELEHPDPARHPIDDWSRQVANELLAELRPRGVVGRVVLPGDERTLNFLQLGEMAGVGTISPVIHQLLHPTFGPWISLRAALLLDGEPMRDAPVGHAVDDGFRPCEGCDRPCVAACPTRTYGALSGPRLENCASHRIEGGCLRSCEVRRACRLGQDHRYSEAEEAFRHAHANFMIQAATRAQNGAVSGMRARLTRLLRWPRG